MTENKSTNITWQEGSVSRADREKLLDQRGCVIWLTGLSGSGKSTIAYLLEQQLIANGNLAFVLDGDNVRHGVNSDLDFSPDDRVENIRRIGEIAALFASSGVITIASFISPYNAGRQAARKAAGDGRFIEILLNVPLSECESRDPKGLYKKARSGEIVDFTGIDSVYEPPVNPEITLATHTMTPAECVETIISHLQEHDFIVG